MSPLNCVSLDERLGQLCTKLRQQNSTKQTKESGTCGHKKEEEMDSINPCPVCSVTGLLLEFHTGLILLTGEQRKSCSESRNLNYTRCYFGKQQQHCWGEVCCFLSLYLHVQNCCCLTAKCSPRHHSRDSGC